jgi:hypothetical protein
MNAELIKKLKGAGFSLRQGDIEIEGIRYDLPSLEALEACDLSDPEHPPSPCPISQRLLRYLISCALRAVFPPPRIPRKKFQKIGLASCTAKRQGRPRGWPSRALAIDVMWGDQQ